MAMATITSTCRDGMGWSHGMPAQPSPACAHAASQILQTQETKSVVFARPSSSIRFVSPSHQVDGDETPSAFRAVSQTHSSGYTPRLVLLKPSAYSNLIHHLPYRLLLLTPARPRYRTRARAKPRRVDAASQPQPHQRKH